MNMSDAQLVNQLIDIGDWIIPNEPALLVEAGRRIAAQDMRWALLYALRGLERRRRYNR